MISSQELGKRIAFARKRAGLTQAQLAEQLGVSRPVVIAVEKGERRPSDQEVFKLATLLSVQVNDLLREHAVLGEISPRFHAATKARAPEVEQAVEQLRELGAQYAELESMLGIARTAAPLEAVNAFRQAAAIDAAPEPAACEAASHVRRTLGLGDGAVLGLDDELEWEAGFRIFALPFAPNLAAVFIWGEQLGPCVGLNACLPLPRRRACLAHELGHFLRDPEAGDVLFAAPPRSRDPAERFCDAFARELLMSAEGLRRRVSRLRRIRGGQLTVGDLVALANAYEVSFQAMTLRLEELAVVGRGTYESIEERGFRPQAAEKEPKYEAQLQLLEGYSRRYLQLAFEAYDAALLSEGELARFLHCDRMVARVASLSRRMVEDDQGHGLDLDFARTLNGKGSKAP